MLEEILRPGLAEMHLPYSEAAIRDFRNYYDLLYEKNKVMNLTAIQGEDESARLHFLDSVTPLLHFDFKGKSVIDVGTGAGFPGLPIRIICPEAELTLIDSLQKRIGFLQEVCDKLGYSDVKCIHMRAEEGKAMREGYDFAVSRAVARLNVLCELCMPYVRTGGYFLALKGPALEDELEEARNAIHLLGGRQEETISCRIPGLDVSHKIAVIRKVSNTPSRFPRKFSAIKKQPL